MMKVKEQTIACMIEPMPSVTDQAEKDAVSIFARDENDEELPYVLTMHLFGGTCRALEVTAVSKFEIRIITFEKMLDYNLYLTRHHRLMDETLGKDFENPNSVFVKQRNK